MSENRGSKPGIVRGHYNKADKPVKVVKSKKIVQAGKAPSSGARNYCFTLNNYTEEDIYEISLLTTNLNTKVRYVCYGKEIGEDKKTPHLQGYIEFTEQVRGSAIHDMLGLHNAYNEPRKGTQKRAIDYCKKGDQSHHDFIILGTDGPTFGLNAQFFEYGKQGGDQGTRSDLQTFYALVRDGKNDLELAEASFSTFARTLKAIDRIRSHMKPVLLAPRRVIGVFGAPGKGKTRWANDTYPLLFELAIGSLLWYDGYHGQDVVMFDEFNGELPLNSLLKVADNYYVRQVPIKGSFVWWNPKIIIFTSNYKPSSWYDYSKRPISEVALRRRFTEIYWYNDDDTVDHYTTPAEIANFWPLPCDAPKPTVNSVLMGARYHPVTNSFTNDTMRECNFCHLSQCICDMYS